MISGRRSQCHLALASVKSTLCSGRLKETELYLLSNETACLVKPNRVRYLYYTTGNILDVDHNVNNEADGPF